MKTEHNVERLSYSVQEAAAAIGVSSRTVHDFIKSGTIAHFRMGTRVLIPVDELRAFIARRTQEGGAV
jgi:excisionase family DNA binding protein